MGNYGPTGKYRGYGYVRGRRGYSYRHGQRRRLYGAGGAASYSYQRSLAAPRLKYLKPEVGARVPGTLGSLTMQRTDETPNRKLSSNRNRKKTNKASTRREEVEDARARTWPSERSLQGALPTKQRHTSYQHSSANLPTLLRQQGSYRALRHSPTKETQAPTSEKNPKPSLSLSAVRKVRPGKHEGGLRGQLRATDATTLCASARGRTKVLT